MMNLGIPIGLARDFDDNRIEQLRYDEMANKRVKDEQEAKAKMFADDTDYNNAMNSFDNPIIKEFARGKIKEIGQFVNANPDWQSNVAKRIQYKQLIKDLKDNPDLIRGIQSDEGIKRYRAYIADPKNADIIGTPEFKMETDRMNNYLKTGGDKGDGIKTAYDFMAPEEAKDYTSYLMTIAKGTAKHGTANAAGAGGYRQFVTDADKQSALQLAKSNPMYKYLKKDFQSETEKGTTKFKDVDSYVLDKMQPYFPEDDIKSGQFFAPAKELRGPNDPKEPPKNPWEYTLKTAQQKGDGTVQVAPATLFDTLADKDGKFDLTQASIVDKSNGNKTPIDLGKGKADPIGDVKYIRNDKGGGYFAIPVKIKLPLNQFISHFGNEAIDYGGVLGGMVDQNDPNSNDWTVHNGDGWDKDYTDTFEKVVDDKGNSYIQFDAELPVQDNEVVASRFNASLAAGKQADAFTSDKTQSEETTTDKQPSSKNDLSGEYVDTKTGKTWIGDKNGKFVRWK